MYCITSGLFYENSTELDEVAADQHSHCTRHKKFAFHHAYTRSGEHLRRLGAWDIIGSPLWRHCVEEHEGETQQFGMSVAGSYRNDTILRQMSEAVQLERTETELFNICNTYLRTLCMYLQICRSKKIFISENRHTCIYSMVPTLFWGEKFRIFRLF